ncbi:MAG TPA: hypothetical protein VLR91_07750, partial [Thermodesulfobacteriota bacterium]|nr:hypothetical protein [Thermodesulfobacteriota bacterium]
MHNCTIVPNRSRRACLNSTRSRIVLGGIVGVSLCLAVMGCASLGRIGLGETGDSATSTTSKGQSYYHFLKAQQLLVADNAAGAIQ